ncbi:unnamed protein product [Candida verbasci]|uniref:PQ-loop repeat-containing protein 1 n=1 Tax=Candida verbasci TaxID=1227364 RepID=A0A9W4TVU1_9ASCO|nr:unnamed protein product [Candida verbasci]
MSSYFDKYVPYLPDKHTSINLFMTFTPLFSYGSTCYSIYKKQTSLGFSIDICATMFMASILRILYYVTSPYELTLLRQSCVMIGIQSLLLKISLRYRPINYDPELLINLPNFENELNGRLHRRLSSSHAIVEHERYKNVLDVLQDYAILALNYVVTALSLFVKLFDVYFKRPCLFWQWKEEKKYWKYLVYFTGVFSVLTLLLKDSVFYSNFIGILGLFIESLLPLPQILLLTRLQSVKNFKIILLLSWLGGDLTKISYLLFGTNNISIIFILAGLFQMSLDLIIAYQYIILKWYGPWKEPFLDSGDDLINNLILNNNSTSEIELDLLEKQPSPLTKSTSSLIIE